MSHDCDCYHCRENDSRWAYQREADRAKKEDCPRGLHVSKLWSTSSNVPYRCKNCDIGMNRVWHDGMWNDIVLLPRMWLKKDEIKRK